MSFVRIEPYSPTLNSAVRSHTLKVPGDKSISHRALLFGALARGSTEISNLLEAEDVRSTETCLRHLGIQITRTGSGWSVLGQGRERLKTPLTHLDCGNSGTTVRLLMGVLAAEPFLAHLHGDASLSNRPMKRVAEPLRKMGAQIQLSSAGTAPVQILGTRSLQAINYSLPVASAQLKSALLLAGLSAEGTTRLSGQIFSRDHTERLLQHFGVHVERTQGQEFLNPSHPIDQPESDATYLSIKGGQELTAAKIIVPGDISSAAFWLGLGTLIPCGTIEIQDVLLNPTRIGILTLLQKMGAQIRFEITSSHPEPLGWIKVNHSELRGIEIHPNEVPTLIDELPLIAVLAAFANGTTIVRGAEELRVKETDRLEAIACNLRAMGGAIELFPDGFAIEGPQRLRGNAMESFGDHRIAMAFSIAALKADTSSEIRGSECVSISYPKFYETLNSLTSSSSKAATLLGS